MLVTEAQLRAYRALDDLIVEKTQRELEALLDDMDERVAKHELNLSTDYYDSDNGIVMQEYYDLVYSFWIDKLV